MPSACTPNETVLVEVKTAQDRNRGVIRARQIEKYQSNTHATNIYYAQLFYRMKNGKVPSQCQLEDFEANFFPICAFVFPISFIVYLVNTIHPTWRKESTQFYGLTHHRARKLFGLLHDREWFTDEIQERFRSAVFSTVHLNANPEAKLHIIDHVRTPHILWMIWV